MIYPKEFEMSLRQEPTVVGMLCGIVPALKRSYFNLWGTDPLTGLYNQSYFFADIRLRVSRAESDMKNSRPLNLVFFDFNNLKDYNTRNGHWRGNEAVKRFGHVIEDKYGEGDTTARFGGDEFLALTNYEEHRAAEIATNVHDYMRTPSGFEEPLVIAWGMSVWQPGMSPQEFFDIANARMFNHKARLKAGRNSTYEAIADARSSVIDFPVSSALENAHNTHFASSTSSG